MSNRDLKERATRIYAGICADDPSEFVASLADDLLVRIHGPAPHAGTYTGKDTFLEVMGVAHQTMLDETRTVEKVLVDGQSVVIVGVEEFTVAPTGMRVRGRYLHHLEFRGDQITLFEDFEPTGAHAWK